MMKLIRMLTRGIRDAFKSVFRNFSLSIASVSCISITLIVIAVSLLVSFNVNHATENIKKNYEFLVWLDIKATDLDLEQIDAQLRKIDNIESLTLITKQQSKEEIIKEKDILGSIIEDMDDDELPIRDCYYVKVSNLEKIDDTVEQIKKIDMIYKVSYSKSMIQKMLPAFKTIQNIMIVIVVALIIVNVFLIVNTIKLTIFSRKREISIMRLVGASNFSIKYPFVIEGMVIGMIGAIIPILIVIYGYTYFYNYFGGVFLTEAVDLIDPQPFVFLISLAVLCIGMIVGMLGSSRAVRKYLKV